MMILLEDDGPEFPNLTSSAVNTIMRGGLHAYLSLHPF